MKLINVLVVDDHEIIYDGIESMLSGQEFIQSLDYCPSIKRLKIFLSKKKYDVIVLDINLAGENALESVQEIRHLNSAAKIIILTSYESFRLIQRTKELNLDGFILKNTTKIEFLKAIQIVLSGKKYFPDLKDATPSKFLLSIDLFANKNILSKRELELAKCLIAGLNEKEIAEKLFISRHTVRTHKKNIFKKLNVSGVMGLIKLIKNNEV